MRKNLIYLLLIITAFGSCKRENDPVFDQTADERINAKLGEYQQLLTSAANGWTGTLVTRIGSTYSFYFRFNDSNRVLMYSDYDATTAGVVKESSYRLKALQQPSLIFDTYSYIHILADPDAGVNGGYYGSGLISDFEFSMDSVSADQVFLTGRFNGSQAVLRKATQQERAAWETKQVQQTELGFRNMGKILNYFKRLTYNGVEYEIRIDSIFKEAIVTWMGASGKAQTFTTGYYFSPVGFQFVSPLVNGSATIAGFNIVSWNDATATLNVQVNGSAATITGAIKPVSPDVTAAKRWWQYSADNQVYSYSVNGFHVNGVDDAYHLQTLKTDTSVYYYLVYQAGIQPQSGSSYDVMTPFYLIPAARKLDYIYGTAQRPAFQNDGRVLFNYLGDLLVGPYPDSGPAADTRVQLYSSYGYWFVQTGSGRFDMVSAKDAKAWVSWQF